MRSSTTNSPAGGAGKGSTPMLRRRNAAEAWVLDTCLDDPIQQPSHDAESLENQGNQVVAPTGIEPEQRLLLRALPFTGTLAIQRSTQSAPTTHHSLAQGHRRYGNRVATVTGLLCLRPSALLVARHGAAARSSI